jgi:broad specificity phosphatase PhoE
MKLIVKPFYFMRHGESLANVSGITSGFLDAPLTETGLIQAQKAASIFSYFNNNIKVIYTSALMRAFHTAVIVSTKIEAPIRVKNDFNEQYFGEWEGKKWSSVLDRLKSHSVPPKGETAIDFSQRIQKALTQALHESNSEPLIIAHGGFFYALSSLYGENLSFTVENCGLFYFEPIRTLRSKNFPWNIWKLSTSQQEASSKENMIMKTLVYMR